VKPLSSSQGFRNAVVTSFVLASGLLLATLAVARTAPQEPSAASKLHRIPAYDELPITFERNDGQTDPRVEFIARGKGYTLFLTAAEAVLGLRAKSKRQVVRIRPVGASPRARIEGLEKTSAKSNYFIGNDPKRWQTNVPSYSRVRYRDVYPGIDLVYHATGQRELEYDFVLAPGANPATIALRIEGAKQLALDRNGDVIVTLADGGELIHHAPAIYQERGGKREKVSGRCVIKSRDTIGFELASYDRARRLFIDPGLVYSTYLGGNGDDSANGIAVDSSGNAYVVGTTPSTNFPTTTGAFQATSPDPGNFVAFVTKFNAAGSALLYSTYVGGTSGSSGGAIAVDSSGSAYITGDTISFDFPVTSGAFQPSAGMLDVADAFVTKLSPDGASLAYSSYLGGIHQNHAGNGHDIGYGIAVDSNNNAYVTGNTDSTDFPTTSGAFVTSNPNAQNFAFATKVTADGSGLVYSTLLGVAFPGFGGGIAADSSGNAYVTWTGVGSSCPVTAGAFQTSSGGNSDACVTKLNSDGSAPVYGTFLGGSGADFSWGIAIDSDGNAYVTGSAGSTNFPTTPGAFQSSVAGGHSVFVTKFNVDGSALAYSTYIGGGNAGSGDDTGFAIALDSDKNAYVTGRFSFTFPTTTGAFQTTKPGQPPVHNGFVTKLSADGSSLLYSTYLGGANEDSGLGIAVDSSKNAYVAGETQSTNFPTTGGAFQTSSGGGAGDGFVAKFDLNLTPTPTTTGAPTPTSTPNPAATATPTTTATATATAASTATTTATPSPGAPATPTSTETPGGAPTPTTVPTSTATPGSPGPTPTTGSNPAPTPVETTGGSSPPPAPGGSVTILKRGDFRSTVATDLDSGRVQIFNSTNDAEVIDSITVQVSDPSLLAALTLTCGSGGATVRATARPVTTSNILSFSTPLTIAAAANAICDLVVTTASAVAQRERHDLSYASAAPPTSNGGQPLAPIAGGLAFIGSLEIVVAGRRRRWPLLGAVLLVVALLGCGSGDPKGRSTAQTITGVSARNSNGPVSFAGLPVEIGTAAVITPH
jgi:hypothetical protein